MNAIISNGDYTASLQLPAERKQLAGVLSYLGANHANDYDVKYNEDSDSKLWFSLDCRGVVENAIAKVIPVGCKFNALNDTIALMNNLPYQSRREIENTIKVEGVASFEQLNRMLKEAYPQSVTTKYYCPLTIQVHNTDCWGDIDEEGYVISLNDEIEQYNSLVALAFDGDANTRFELTVDVAQLAGVDTSKILKTDEERDAFFSTSDCN